MHQPHALAAAESAVLAMALRAVFARTAADRPDLRELRISCTAEALPGLAVIEWEVIDHEGMAFAGGIL